MAISPDDFNIREGEFFDAMLKEALALNPQLTVSEVFEKKFPQTIPLLKSLKARPINKLSSADLIIIKSILQKDPSFGRGSLEGSAARAQKAYDSGFASKGSYEETFYEATSLIEGKVCKEEGNIARDLTDLRFIYRFQKILKERFETKKFYDDPEACEVALRENLKSCLKEPSLVPLQFSQDHLEHQRGSFMSLSLEGFDTIRIDSMESASIFLDRVDRFIERDYSQLATSQKIALKKTLLTFCSQYSPIAVSSSSTRFFLSLNEDLPFSIKPNFCSISIVSNPPNGLRVRVISSSKDKIALSHGHLAPSTVENALRTLGADFVLESDARASFECILEGEEVSLRFLSPPSTVIHVNRDLKTI